MTFSPGDVVRLKSGGPKMTVLEGGDTEKVRCKWFDRNGKLHDAAFEITLLDEFITKPRDD